MSLINDALKKAQRQRASAAVDPPMPGGTSAGGRPGKHGRTMPAQTLLLIAIGAAVLIIVSVVATVYLLRSPAAPPVTPKPIVAAVKMAPPTASVALTSPAPVIRVPEVRASAAESINRAPAAGPAPSVDTPLVVTTPLLVASSAPAEPGPAASPVVRAALPDDRIYAYLDRMQVSGVRMAGGNSKVLLNGRVYEVDDIVDHNLHLRLVKVEAEGLTFVDASGITYTKRF
ncbi:MAG: hypothetical protein ACHQ4G_01180 [Opitutales bacterium]